MKFVLLIFIVIYVSCGNQQVIGYDIEPNIKSVDELKTRAEPCPEGWIASEGHCYYFNVDEGKVNLK